MDFSVRPPRDAQAMIPSVLDFKTSSRIGTRLSAAELRRDLQMGLYAWSLFGDDLGAHGGPTHVAVSHLVLSTAARQVELTSVQLSPSEVRAIVDRAEDTARQMIPLAPVRDAAEVPYNRSACSKWGGCAHLARCPNAPNRGTLFGSAVSDSNNVHNAHTTEGVNMSQPYDLAALFGGAVQVAAAVTAPVAQAVEVAPHAILPPDAPRGTPMADTVQAVVSFGKWPGDKVVTALAEDARLDLEAVRAAVRAASPGFPVPDASAPAAAAAAPAAPKGPTAKEVELKEDLRVAYGVMTGAPGDETWWAAFRTARGVARIGEARKAAILDGLTLSRIGRPAGDPGVAAEVRAEVEADWAARVAPAAEVRAEVTVDLDSARRVFLDTAMDLARGGASIETIITRLVMNAAPGPLASRMADYAVNRAAVERQQTVSAAASDPPASTTTAMRDATEPPPVTEPNRVAARSPIPAPVTVLVLLIDALPIGVPAMYLRGVLEAQIKAVEAAEDRPLDLIDYGKGPAMVAARLANQPIVPGGPGIAFVHASTADKLTEAVTPVLAGQGWFVVRSVR